MNPSTIDLLLGAILLLGARAGLRRGLGDSLWPAVCWTLIAFMGASSATDLATRLTQLAPIPPITAACLTYLGVALAIAKLVRLVETRFGDRLLAALPMGKVDQALGWCCGLVSASAACLVAFALLNPWYVESVDWNPREMSGDQAMAALGSAVVGSLRRLILEESYLGRAAVEHLHSFLIPIPG